MTDTNRQFKFLFYRGTGIIGRAIRWQTRSDFGHVAIKAPSGAVYEALHPQGVVCWPNGRPDECLATHLTLDVSEDRAERMEKWLRAQVGKPYDRRAIFRFVSRGTYWSNDRWFCSELAFDCALQNGLELLSRCPSYEVSPGKLYQSPLLRLPPIG